MNIEEKLKETSENMTGLQLDFADFLVRKKLYKNDYRKNVIDFIEQETNFIKHCVRATIEAYEELINGESLVKNYSTLKELSLYAEKDDSINDIIKKYFKN